MGDRVQVATRKGLFTVGRGSAGWSVTDTAFLGDPVVLVHTAADGTLYAALQHGHFGGKLHRRAPGGDWEEVAVPVYPERPDDADDVNPNLGEPVPWRLKTIWALADDPRRPGALWCGTLPGGLFHSADGGESWDLVESLWLHPSRKEWFGGGADEPGIHSICVDPRDTERVLVGVSCGGVWASDDGGATWECRADGMRAEYMPPDRAHEPGIQDPHHIEQLPRRTRTCCGAQHHNGIFRSDGRDSRSWTGGRGGSAVATFGFRVRGASGRTRDVAWFVPAVKDEVRIPVDGKRGRHEDHATAAPDLRSPGPPGPARSPHAYDLVFRHALDIDARGERLAFGSTTGSLWISEDQGDSWITVSTHLPPVYAVRFG